MSEVEFYTPDYGWGSGVRLQWVACSNGHYPENAVEAGSDSGARLLVARARIGGALVPGKLHVGHNACYIPENGLENPVYNYEVLVAPPGMLRWVPSQKGHKVPNAVIGGRSANGEVYFVGKCRNQGTLTPGKVHPSHGVCYVPYGGKEVGHPHYEVLIR